MSERLTKWLDDPILIRNVEVVCDWQLGKTQATIAKERGISRGRVSQIIVGFNARCEFYKINPDQCDEETFARCASLRTWRGWRLTPSKKKGRFEP